MTAGSSGPWRVHWYTCNWNAIRAYVTTPVDLLRHGSVHSSALSRVQAWAIRAGRPAVAPVASLRPPRHRCSPREWQRPMQIGTGGVAVAWTMICAAICQTSQSMYNVIGYTLKPYIHLTEIKTNSTAWFTSRSWKIIVSFIHEWMFIASPN